MQHKALCPAMISTLYECRQCFNWFIACHHALTGLLYITGMNGILNSSSKFESQLAHIIGSSDLKVTMDFKMTGDYKLNDSQNYEYGDTILDPCGPGDMIVHDDVCDVIANGYLPNTASSDISDTKTEV